MSGSVRPPTMQAKSPERQARAAGPVAAEIPAVLSSGVRDGRGLIRLARIAALGGTDLLALVLAAGVAYALWALPAKGQSIALYIGLAPLLGLFSFGYAMAGLYPGFGLGPVETLRRLSYVTA